MLPNTERTMRFGRWAVGAALALCTAIPSLAHEDEAGASRVADAVAPGMTALGVLILAALVVGLWYHFRREAMLRAYRQAHTSTSASDGRPSEGP